MSIAHIPPRTDLSSPSPFVCRAGRRAAAVLGAFLGAWLQLLGGAQAREDAPACPPETLGISRVLTVPAGVQVGTKSFPETLPLEDKEVVLTFDDGPWPGTTAAILDALKAQCVRATFFLIGENARARPALVKRQVAEGHTVAHHSMTHPEKTLAKLPFDSARAEIDQGMAADDAAAYGTTAGTPRIPFFRFPGFASTPQLLEDLKRRGISVFGADLWASDWNVMSPGQQLALVLGRLESAGRGIVLFHDTKAQTAAMIPAFLAALKERGYRVVHIVPAQAGAR